MNGCEFPREIASGTWPYGHCQGIALDRRNGCMYFSFTTALIKTDLRGRLLGSVTGLIGHLGCIAFCEEDGMLYGSLECKWDEIGRGVARTSGRGLSGEEAFYIVRFDGARVTAPSMDASSAGVMEAACLAEVAADYRARSYGCSGIDGLTFAPMFGAERGSEKHLFVAYGVYGDLTRADNDHQVILAYSRSELSQCMRPLRMEEMHASGPKRPLHKLFAFTGNTTYGVQNMEYDPFTGDVLLAVYPGRKPQYPNYPLFVLDGRAAPALRPLRGLDEAGFTLSLAPGGLEDPASGLRGYAFPLGSTGLNALGDGHFYVSHDAKEADGWSCTARLYRWDGKAPLTAC